MVTSYLGTDGVPPPGTQEEFGLDGLGLGGGGARAARETAPEVQRPQIQERRVRGGRLRRLLPKRPPTRSPVLLTYFNQESSLKKIQKPANNLRLFRK